MLVVARRGKGMYRVDPTEVPTTQARLWQTIGLYLTSRALWRAEFLQQRRARKGLMG